MTDDRQDDRFDKLMRDAADTFRRPPEPPIDEMWAEIEARAGFGSVTPKISPAGIVEFDVNLVGDVTTENDGTSGSP